MIFRMKPKANILMIERVVKTLTSKGCDVQIDDTNGAAVIAAFGIGADRLTIIDKEMLPGVESFDPDNTFFTKKNGEGFMEPWEFFQKREARE